MGVPSLCTETSTPSPLLLAVMVTGELLAPCWTALLTRLDTTWLSLFSSHSPTNSSSPCSWKMRSRKTACISSTTPSQMRRKQVGAGCMVIPDPSRTRAEEVVDHVRYTSRANQYLRRKLRETLGRFGPQ